MGDDKLLQRARERLRREFPELARASAQITAQSGGRYLIVFRGHVAVPGGAQMERVVRAVVDDRGKIVKWSTSR